jgi:hypothetical protein
MAEWHFGKLAEFTPFYQYGNLTFSLITKEYHMSSHNTPYNTTADTAAYNAALADAILDKPMKVDHWSKQLSMMSESLWVQLNRMHSLLENHGHTLERVAEIDREINTIMSLRARINLLQYDLTSWNTNGIKSE